MPILAFAHIEKCGGTTLIHVLRREFGLDHFDVIPRDKESMIFGPDDARALLRLRPSVKSLAGHSIRLASRIEEVVDDVRYYTMLRDPYARYISDFRHFVDMLGYPDDFERWLAREDRHEFQTRAIAGKPDLAEAKRVLAERYRLVGVLEDFDEFLSALRVIAAPLRLETDYTIRNRASDRRASREQRDVSSVDKTDRTNIGGKDRGREMERFEDEIRARNRLDTELYQYVRAELIPQQRELLSRTASAAPPLPSRRSRVRDAWRPLLNRLFRNLVYKPYMGYPPFKPHALPPYRRSSVIR